LRKFVDLTPRKKLSSELFAVNRCWQQMPFERDMLTDRPEARQEFLRTSRAAKTRMRRARSRVGWWLFSARLFDGSSAGSAAAVATGMGALTIGSDGGGSVRTPASFNNLFAACTDATAVASVRG